MCKKLAATLQESPRGDATAVKEASEQASIGEEYDLCVICQAKPVDPVEVRLELPYENCNF